MLRSNMLVIRLNQAERAAIDGLAAIERLPVSTLARQILLKAADQRGLLVEPQQDRNQRSCRVVERKEIQQ